MYNVSRPELQIVTELSFYKLLNLIKFKSISFTKYLKMVETVKVDWPVIILK